MPLLSVAIISDWFSIPINIARASTYAFKVKLTGTTVFPHFNTLLVVAFKLQTFLYMHIIPAYSNFDNCYTGLVLKKGTPCHYEITIFEKRCGTMGSRHLAPNCNQNTSQTRTIFCRITLQVIFVPELPDG